MFGPLLNGLVIILRGIFSIVEILVIASILVSWIGDQRNPIVQMIHQMSEPIYRPFRKLTRKIPGPLDWTPVVILLILEALKIIVLGYLNMIVR